jgi:predicted small metal-binding protein
MVRLETQCQQIGREPVPQTFRHMQEVHQEEVIQRQIVQHIHEWRSIQDPQVGPILHRIHKFPVMRMPIR